MKALGFGGSLLVLVLMLGAAGPHPPSGNEPTPSFPRFVTSVDGERLDLLELARDETLVVVTLKATTCPVCQNQLGRLAEHLLELRTCRVGFVVLAPGPAAELRAIRERSGFPYPFVEDVDLAIAKRLGLQLGDKEIVPSLLILAPDLSVTWSQRGRSGRSYGDAALLRQLRCEAWI